MQIYEEGDAFCFSCRESFTKLELEGFKPSTPVPVFKRVSLEEIATLPIRGFSERLIKKNITEFYGVKVSYNAEGEIAKHYYPYEKEAYKVRTLPKDFTWISKSTELFGAEHFAGGGKRLILTEGEIDCLSMQQASFNRYGRMYPVVGLSSSGMTKSILEKRDWIRSFEEVILCFDMDEAGEKATTEALRYIGADKVKIAKLPCNDVNATYLEHGSKIVLQCIFDAQPYVPSGIVSTDEIWEQIEENDKKPSVPYPPCLAGINNKLKGHREGEIVLFVSGTGCFAKDTLIKLASGKNKRVQLVEAGEQVMGKDGTPRNVLRLFTGREPMYIVFVNCGPGEFKQFVCNKSHVLVYYDMARQEHGTIKVGDFMRLPEKRKGDMMGVRKVGKLVYSQMYVQRYAIEADYYGFEVDADHQFVLGNGVVTHNSGKSTMIREDILHLLEVTDKKIGIISLEESPAETGTLLAGMHMKKNLSNEDVPVSELKTSFYEVFKDDRLIVMDHQGSMSDDSIIDKIEYMYLAGCGYIMIDHLTMLVSEGAGRLTGNEAQDKVLNDLLRLVKKYPLWIGLVAHLRKTGGNTGKSFEEGRIPSMDDIKGSGSAKQVPFDIIAFARDMTAEDEDIQNTIIIRILKARRTGKLGSVRGVKYIPETGRLQALPDPEQFTEI